MNLMNNIAETEQTVDSEFFQMLTLATLLHDSTTLKSITKEDLMHNDVSTVFCFTMLRLISPSFPYT